MSHPRKTVSVTGIGAGIVKGFVDGFQRGCQFPEGDPIHEVAASNQVVLVDGHIGELLLQPRSSRWRCLASSRLT